MEEIGIRRHYETFVFWRCLTVETIGVEKTPDKTIEQCQEEVEQNHMKMCKKYSKAKAKAYW